jgi:hypothetical protein
MQVDDERNILRIGPPARPGEAEVTPAIVEAVRQLLKGAGGILTVWLVLHEDLYDSPSYRDDESDISVHLAIRGIALNSVDAERLSALDQPRSQFTKWHIKGYRLGLKDNVPLILRAWSEDERFTINDVVELLCEIPPGGTASKLHTGSGWRKDGPLLSLP